MIFFFSLKKVDVVFFCIFFSNFAVAPNLIFRGFVFLFIHYPPVLNAGSSKTLSQKKKRKKKKLKTVCVCLRDKCVGWTERSSCFLPSGLKARAFYQSPFKWGFFGLGTCLCSTQQRKMLLKESCDNNLAQINKYTYVFLQCYVFI